MTTGTTACEDEKSSKSVSLTEALTAFDTTRDGVDDDCDGETDEDYGARRSRGIGAPVTAGSTVCEGGTLTICNAIDAQRLSMGPVMGSTMIAMDRRMKTMWATL